MVIVRTPLRLSIVGGGTDLPAWYKEHGSVFVSAAIDKYIYTTVHHSDYDEKIRVRYSKLEEVDNVNDIQNEIVRETLKHCEVTRGIEVTTHAEIPSGTGLGSSGAFGVGLLHTLKPSLDKNLLAGIASEIQMKNLKYPIGWQDQLVAALGTKIFGIDPSERVTSLPIDLSSIEDKLVIFYTGIKRDANEVLKHSSMEGLEKIQELAVAFIKNPDDYGEILKEHWEHKKKRGGMTNRKIDELYELGLKNGAVGGKVVGAGGGGFLMFYTDDRERLINSMTLMHQPFRFEYEGSKVIHGD